MNNITHSTIPQDSQDEIQRISLQHQSLEEIKQRTQSVPLESRLLNAAQNNEKKELLNLIHSNPTLQIYSLVNQKKFTLLHFATFNNQEDIALIIIDHIKAQNHDILQNYINQQTSDGFTCLHFAAYRGNLNLLKQYKELGADVNKKNEHGMNIMHIAAQGDQPIGIVFAYEHNILPVELDLKGGSPLHWSCFYGCEQATIYLLSLIKQNKEFQPLINLLDEQQLTPLHLAVMSGNSRLIKKLLIAGADRNKQGKKGQTPAKLAQEHEYQNIYNMITNEENCCLQYYNIKQTLRPIKKSIFELLKFIILIFYELGTYIAFKNIENIKTMSGLIFHLDLMDIILFSLSGLSFLEFIMITNMDPGYQKRRQNSLLDLLQKFECYEICPYCNLIKLPRSKHCDICQRCVMVYDHHCPWINNCIGAKNHGFFLLFILTLICNIVCLLYCLVNNFYDFYHTHDFLYKDYFEYLRVVLLAINALVGLLFTIALLLLTFTQMGNFLQGLTTLERFQQKSGNQSIVTTQKTTSPSLKTSLLTKNENHYEMNNFIDFCCRNYKLYRKKEKEQPI